MAFGLITLWQIGRKVRTVTDFIFLGFKVTAYGDCSEIQRCLPLERKTMTNLDIFKKWRHHFANNGPYGQSYGLSSSQVWL